MLNISGQRSGHFDGIEVISGSHPVKRGEKREKNANNLSWASSIVEPRPNQMIPRVVIGAIYKVERSRLISYVM